MENGPYSAQTAEKAVSRKSVLGAKILKMKVRLDLIKKGIPVNAGMARFKKDGSLVRSAQTRIGQAPRSINDCFQNRITRQPGQPIFADLALSPALVLRKKIVQIWADLSAREEIALSMHSKIRPLKPASFGLFKNRILAKIKMSISCTFALVQIFVNACFMPKNMLQE